MIQTKWISIILLSSTLWWTSCGVKRYEVPTQCEDLSTVFYDEQDPSLWSEPQRNAVTRFESLEGEWLVTLRCVGEDETEARLQIAEALQTNVELYEDVDAADCESFGKAIFEARVTDSGDLDLDDTTFALTADLLKRTASGGNLLEAASLGKASQYSDVASFQLTVTISDTGEKIAAKEVTLLPETSSDPNRAISVTQRVECFLTDWTRQ